MLSKVKFKKILLAMNDMPLHISVELIYLWCNSEVVHVSLEYSALIYCGRVQPAD